MHVVRRTALVIGRGVLRTGLGRWVPAGLKDAVWNEINKVPSYVIRVHGCRMVIPAGPWNKAYLCDSYEKGTTSVLRSILQQGEVFIDIGANIGYYTILAAKVVGESGRVVAFEPEPGNVRVLRENVKMAGCKWVDVVEAAVCGSSGRRRLFMSRRPGHHSVLCDPVEGTGIALDVEALRLDEYLSKRGMTRVNVIKIDAEGAEGEILEGMGGLLDSAAGPRAIIFEHECGKENIGGSYAGNIISRLKRHGFERIFGITRRGDLLAIAGESRTREIHTHEIENYIAMTNRQK